MIGKAISFASGVIFALVVALAACGGPVYGGGPGPGPGYGPPPGPPGHPVINQAIGELQRTRQMLIDQAASGFGGHKASAIAGIDQAISELNICLSMP
jgi:hypothetical protein